MSNYEEEKFIPYSESNRNPNDLTWTHYGWPDIQTQINQDPDIAVLLARLQESQYSRVLYLNTPRQYSMTFEEYLEKIANPALLRNAGEMTPPPLSFQKKLSTMFKRLTPSRPEGLDPFTDSTVEEDPKKTYANSQFECLGWTEKHPARTFIRQIAIRDGLIHEGTITQQMLARDSVSSEKKTLEAQASLTFLKRAQISGKDRDIFVMTLMSQAPFGMKAVFDHSGALSKIITGAQSGVPFPTFKYPPHIKKTQVELPINTTNMLGTQTYERKTEPASATSASYVAHVNLEQQTLSNGVQRLEPGNHFINGQQVHMAFTPTHLRFISGEVGNVVFGADIPIQLSGPIKDLKKSILSSTPDRNLSNMPRYLNTTFFTQGKGFDFTPHQT